MSPVRRADCLAFFKDPAVRSARVLHPSCLPLATIFNAGHRTPRTFCLQAAAAAAAKINGTVVPGSAKPLRVRHASFLCLWVCICIRVCVLLAHRVYGPSCRLTSRSLTRALGDPASRVQQHVMMMRSLRLQQPSARRRLTGTTVGCSEYELVCSLAWSFNFRCVLCVCEYTPVRKPTDGSACSMNSSSPSSGKRL